MMWCKKLLRSGASGYVFKLNTAKELLAAVDAVLRGESSQ